MCRFLLVRSRIPFQPGEILGKFADMAKKSKALDGDWQGDGWGICWLSGDKKWDLKKSIHPIWEDKHLFSQLPKSRLFMVHVRSASFPRHKGVKAYNQPFLKEPYAFVFNGLVKGVCLSNSAGATIGSQKIWTILSNLLRQSSPFESLIHLKKLLVRNSRHVQALNIGLCDKKNFFAYCLYFSNPEYYNLQFHESLSLRMISSEPLEGYDFKPIMPDRVLTL